MTEFNPIDVMWTEKYRPKKVGDVVGNFKSKILKYLNSPSTMPHFLLYSKTPGTGKTTLAKAIINELGCDYIVINSSDDRKLDVIRDKVKRFATTKSSKDGLRRCVFLDEADGMSGVAKASQDALRNVMETYARNVFFILTCNNINKIIEPLKSRCVLIPFSFPEKKDIYKYLENICKVENMSYTEGGIKLLVDKNYPSIRNCVLALQDLYTEDKPANEANVKPANEAFEQLWDMLQEKKWIEIKKVIFETSIDPRELNQFFWRRALENSEPNVKLLQVTCRNERDFAYGSDPNVIFVTSLIEMVR